MSRFANSKFFGGGDDSSSEESDHSQEEEQKQAVATAAVKTTRAKFMESDDEEEEERTIKSGKTKRLEALEKILEDTRKHANIGDFNALETDFNGLEAELKKGADFIMEG